MGHTSGMGAVRRSSTGVLQNTSTMRRAPAHPQSYNAPDMPSKDLRWKILKLRKHKHFGPRRRPAGDGVGGEHPRRGNGVPFRATNPVGKEVAWSEMRCHTASLRPCVSPERILIMLRIRRSYSALLRRV